MLKPVKYVGLSIFLNIYTAESHERTLVCWENMPIYVKNTCFFLFAIYIKCKDVFC